MNLVEIVTCCDNPDILATIADTVINEHLGAAAHVRGPLRSVYRWQGDVIVTTEWELDIVTTRHHTQAVIARIEELHPYDTPSTLTRPVAAGQQFTRWVQDQTRNGPTDSQPTPPDLAGPT